MHVGLFQVGGKGAAMCLSSSSPVQSSRFFCSYVPTMKCRQTVYQCLSLNSFFMCVIGCSNRRNKYSDKSLINIIQATNEKYGERRE